MRLKASEICAFREQCIRDQANRCPLCEQELLPADAVLDHCHRTGLVRRAIHRFCNTFLGKIENNVTRNRITEIQLAAILRNYQVYVADTVNILHPTHRTPEQRQLRAKKRAKQRRVVKKQQPKT